MISRIILLLFIILSSGCATITRGTKEAYVVETDPTGATVTSSTESGSKALDAFYIDEFKEFSQAIKPHTEQLDRCIEEMERFENGEIFLEPKECLRVFENVGAKVRPLIEDLIIVMKSYQESLGRPLPALETLPLEVLEEAVLAQRTLMEAHESAGALMRIWSVKYQQILKQLERQSQDREKKKSMGEIPVEQADGSIIFGGTIFAKQSGVSSAGDHVSYCFFGFNGKHGGKNAFSFSGSFGFMNPASHGPVPFLKLTSATLKADGTREKHPIRAGWIHAESAKTYNKLTGRIKLTQPGDSFFMVGPNHAEEGAKIYNDIASGKTAKIGFRRQGESDYQTYKLAPYKEEADKALNCVLEMTEQ